MDKKPDIPEQKDKEKIKLAYEEAEKDIAADPDTHDEKEAGDDLDEGELAKFEGED